MIYNQIVGGIPLDFEYTYQTHGGKKFPIITEINFRGHVLTEIIDHSLVEEVKSRIFKVLNKDIYDK
jgi:hypothetical protein